MTYLPADLYADIERSVPLACVDFVPVCASDDREQTKIGLILRDSPFGEVWCHLGGRILRGESIAGAIRRHALDTLGVDVALTDDPQPNYVYQWFPPDSVPADAPPHGDDPRKHAISLTFVVELNGDPRPDNEAKQFDYFSLTELPSPLWPGTQGLLERLLPTAVQSAS